MHYKNGRPACNGDKVVLFPTYGSPVIGILYDAKPGNDHCNGRIALISPSDPCPNLKECVHLDDVLAALPKNIPAVDEVDMALSAAIDRTIEFPWLARTA